MDLILTILAVFVVVVANELWWRTKRAHGELSRKFVHLTVGSFVAFWPYYLSPLDIKLLGLAFVIVVSISMQFKVFRSIHGVQRATWGEVYFALSVFILAFVAAKHPHIYTAALLEMSLADGLAAVIGTRFGNANRYTIFGSHKSLVGTLTFLITSCLILGWYSSVAAVSFVSVLPVALLATLLENVAGWGLDNALVPLVVAAVLLKL